MTIETGTDDTVPMGDAHVVSVRGGRLETVDGTASLRVGCEPVLVGRAARCALVVKGPTVSKVHLEVQATDRGVHVRDLDSCNGTFLGETAIVEAYLTAPCELRCGDTRLRFEPEPAYEVLVRAPQRFGALLGTTPEMLELFATLARYSPTSLAIVIHGETGSGKERVAQAIHDASPRRDRPFIAINCATVSENLLEPELFGHVRGAFTGADRAREGLFVEADGGTLFFDEVGEMSAAMQAKLLRVLENQEVRPVGSGRTRKVDVRIVFATHVDLRHAVNKGRLREDLYFRMAQVTVEVPPLRRRLLDLPLLVEDILESLGRPDVRVDDAALTALAACDWPGNVRQLRTVLQRALVESDGGRLMVERAIASTGAKRRKKSAGTYDQAKGDLDRWFYTALHARYGGNVSKMAKAAGKQRFTVRAALRAIGLGGEGDVRRS